MIDNIFANAMNNMNDRSRDALGYDTPGAQPKFHEAMSSRVQSVGVPDPLSVAAPSLSYFVVQNHDGSRGYIRAGNFQVRDGKLLASDGRQVLGYPPDRSQGGLVPLTVPAGTPEGWVNIAENGTVSVADPKALEAADLGNAFLAKTMGQQSTAALPEETGEGVQHKALERVKTLPHQTQGDLDQATSHSALPSSNAGMSTLLSSVPPSNVGLSTLLSPPSQIDPKVDPSGQALSASTAAMDPIGASGIMRNHDTPERFLQNQTQFEGNDAQTIAAQRAMSSDYGQSAAGKTSTDVNIPGMQGGSEAPALGKPIGKIALARFGLGTIVDNNGVPSSRVPVELGVPKSGQIGALRTNSRDIGSVDLMQATRAVATASQVLSAVMTAEQARSSRIKAAMGLIK